MQEDLTGISTVIRMLSEIERKINLPRDDVRILEERVVQLAEHIESHILYSEKAVDKAEESMCKRLEGMNEIRSQLSDQAKTFLTQEAYNAGHRLLEVKVETLQKFMYIITGALLVIQVLIGFLEKYMQ